VTGVALDDEMACIELVGLVTDYFENRLSESDRRRFDEHLAVCEPCVRYVEQFRVTIELTGRLDEGDLDPELRETMLDAFREFRKPESHSD